MKKMATGAMADTAMVIRLNLANGQCLPLVGMIANKPVMPTAGRTIVTYPAAGMMRPMGAPNPRLLARLTIIPRTTMVKIIDSAKVMRLKWNEMRAVGLGSSRSNARILPAGVLAISISPHSGQG